MSSTNTVKNAQWFPVYTHPRAEKKAFEALMNKGIEAYLPLHRQLKQWSDRKKWVEEPLIRSYLFVYMQPKQQAEVLMTKGIARFIYFSGHIASMSGRQIDDLKLLMASPYELEITEEQLQPGEIVILKGGPLKGMKGEVVNYRSSKQLILRLEHLGISILINAAISLVERY
jgi:transcriptional antiterminator RfaH